jgi:hypothetical protein
MDTLLFDKTEKTPFISLEEGLFEFSGRSIVEDAQKIFKPVVERIKTYLPAEASRTVVNFNFDYLNTSSSKCVYDILKVLDELYIKGNDIVINWYYEEGDNDMLDLGVHLKAFIKAPFNFIEIEPANDQFDEFMGNED